MTTFVLPDLGEGLQEAELVAWHVGEGDHVVADQPLVSVETEKAVVEVPSPQDGKIARLCVKPGDRVKVGAPLVEFEEGPRTDTGTIVGELAPAPAQPVPQAVPPTPAVKAAPAVRALAQRLGVDLSEIAAERTRRRGHQRRCRARRPRADRGRTCRAARRGAPRDGCEHGPFAFGNRAGDGVR